MVANPKLAIQTVEEFEAFALLPENTQRSFQFIGGEIVELVSNDISSALGARAAILIGGFVIQHDLGFMTGADGGYRIGNDDYIPDCAFVAKEQRAQPVGEAYSKALPALEVEVLSPSNTDEELRLKVANYTAAGIVVWVINPDKQRVEVFESGKTTQLIGLDGTLDGGSVLPEFSLKVSKLFEKLVRPS